MVKFKKYIGVIILIIGFAGLIVSNKDLFFEINNNAPQELSNDLITQREENSIIELIYVEIRGEVMYPGVYKVEPNLRVIDIVNLAGGFTKDADEYSINKASKITDEMIINVERKVTPTFNYIEPVKIVIEIKGEVKNPGLYSLYPDSRIIDLIEEAGGITDLADIQEVNLAKKLEDGDTIIVPKLEVEKEIYSRMIYVEIEGEVNNPGIYYIPETYDLEDLIYEAGGVTKNCDLTKINWDIKLVLGAKIYIPSYDDEEPILEQESDLININKANIETLITLPGIGNILGQRIIDYRTEFGKFNTIEEIMYVSGIKTSIYEQIKDLITV